VFSTGETNVISLRLNSNGGYFAEKRHIRKDQSVNKVQGGQYIRPRQPNFSLNHGGRRWRYLSGALSFSRFTQAGWWDWPDKV
jgi:hypothetical protein